jgi:hypothetical protein
MITLSTCRWADLYIHGQTNRLAGGQTDRQTERKKEGKKEGLKATYRQTS